MGMGKEIEILKGKLARACRMLEMIGLIDFSGHISGRIPGQQTLLIHPAELPRSEVTPGDFIEVRWNEMGGEQIKEIPQETPIHMAIYQMREDVQSVIHMHSHYSILPSIVGKDLVPVCHHGSIFGAIVPVYPDSEKITTMEQANQMARVLGGAKAVIMKGHGAVVAGSNVEAAFLASLHLEENAKLFVEASVMGNPQPLPEEERKRASANTYKSSSIQKSWDYFVAKGRKAGIFWD